MNVAIFVRFSKFRVGLCYTDRSLAVFSDILTRRCTASLLFYQLPEKDDVTGEGGKMIIVGKIIGNK